LFILYKKYSALSVAVRSASFTASEFQPNVVTLPSLSICISTKSSKLIFSVDCTAALIVLVANSVVFSLAISIKVGRKPRSINQLLNNIVQSKVMLISNKTYLIGGGLRFLNNLFFCI